MNGAGLVGKKIDVDPTLPVVETPKPISVTLNSQSFTLLVFQSSAHSNVSVKLNTVDMTAARRMTSGNKRVSRKAADAHLSH